MARSTTARDVLLFTPNLIGYFRVICSLLSFITMLTFPDSQWKASIALYLSSFVGDLFDGWAARQLDQCSAFGGVLDMMTDRCSTAGLLFILAKEYNAVDDKGPYSLPFFQLTFLWLMILDISSHWVQMFSSLSIGVHHKSKEGNLDKNILVRWFYEYYWFFGYLCCGAEFTYMCLYARLHLSNDRENAIIEEAEDWGVPLLQKGIDWFLFVCLPGCIMKQLVNIAQLSSSCYAIAKHDAEKIRKKA